MEPIQEVDAVRRILYGTDFVTNRERVLREIGEAASAGYDNLLLIVPENQSHEAERRLCEVCGNQISRFAEVVSLPRLASRIFSAAGGCAVTSFDRGGKLLAMSRTCKELRTELKFFASRSGSADYLLSLVELCDELESSRVTSEDLRRAAGNLTGQLAQKIEELAAIVDVYAGVTAGHESSLTRLADRLTDSPELVAGKRVWIDGFTYMTRQEREIALCLAEYAAEFTLVLTGEVQSERDRVFGAVREFAADFRRLDATWERIEPDTARRAPVLNHLTEHLFGAESTPFAGETDAIRLVSAASVSQECLACADAVMQLVRSGKARLEEIHVAYTDPARYRAALSSVFSRYGIPTYYAGSESVENLSVAAFVLTALDAVTGGMEYEDVLRHLKTGFCRIDTESCDRLENYAYTWNIRGNRWFEPWTMHPDGYGGQPDAATEEQLAQLNAARVLAVEPLLALRSGLKQASCVADQIRALYGYFEAVDLCGTLQARAEQLAGTQAALELSQLFELICSALEQMNAILGDQICTEEEFARLVRLLLTQYTVSTITPYLDAVQAGSAENLYRSPCRYLFVLGAEEGLLPSNLTPHSPLSDADREQLRRNDVPILSGTAHDLDFSIASVWYLFSSPDAGLYLSWCAGNDKAPSYLLTRTKLLTGVSIEPCAAYPSILLTNTQTAGALLARAAQEPALEAAAEGCAVFSQEPVKTAAMRWQERARYRMPPLSREGVKRLYGDRLYLSASRVDQQNSCRFAYFMNYGLRAKERKQAAFDAPLFGTFVHAVLENTVRRTMDEGGFGAVERDRVQQIATEEIERYTAEQLQTLGEAGERMRYLFERNRHEIAQIVKSLTDELQRSDFLPVRFELAFSREDGEMPPVEIAGDYPAELSGFVDRVDVYTKDGILYVRVIDYKTGRKSFDYTDILSGIGLQMLIYLFALCELGDAVFGQKPEPAGVLYVPAREPVLGMPEKPNAEDAEKKHSSERTRKGLVLDNDNVLYAMEHTQDSPEFLPFRVKKNGERDGALASASQMELLHQFVMQRLQQTAEEIASGELTPNPYRRDAAHGACNYCPYAQACHLDTFDGAMRVLASTDSAKFWETAGREVRDHG
jgi:ATP-dependent helicase/nuclease subunit B